MQLEMDLGKTKGSGQLFKTSLEKSLLKIHSFSTLDRIKKYDGSDNEENAEKPYSIEVGEIERTINLYAIASTKFQVAV